MGNPSGKPLPLPAYGVALLFCVSFVSALLLAAVLHRWLGWNSLSSEVDVHHLTCELQSLVALRAHATVRPWQQSTERPTQHQMHYQSPTCSVPILTDPDVSDQAFDEDNFFARRTCGIAVDIRGGFIVHLPAHRSA